MQALCLSLLMLRVSCLWVAWWRKPVTTWLWQDSYQLLAKAVCTEDACQISSLKSQSCFLALIELPIFGWNTSPVVDPLDLSVTESCPLLGKFCFKCLVAVFHISVPWFSWSRQNYFLLYLKQRLFSSVIFIAFEHSFNYSPYLPLVVFSVCELCLRDGLDQC